MNEFEGLVLHRTALTTYDGNFNLTHMHQCNALILTGGFLAVKRGLENLTNIGMSGSYAHPYKGCLQDVFIDLYSYDELCGLCRSVDGDKLNIHAQYLPGIDQFQLKARIWLVLDYDNPELHNVGDGLVSGSANCRAGGFVYAAKNRRDVIRLLGTNDQKPVFYKVESDGQVATTIAYVDKDGKPNNYEILTKESFMRNNAKEETISLVTPPTETKARRNSRRKKRDYSS